jgi:hypothetical protein
MCTVFVCRISLLPLRNSDAPVAVAVASRIDQHRIPKVPGLSVEAMKRAIALDGSSLSDTSDNCV